MSCLWLVQSGDNNNNNNNKMADESEFLTSVPKENGNGTYNLYTKWSDTALRVEVASEKGAWAGVATTEKLNEMAQLLKMPPDVFIKECKEALTTDYGKGGIHYAVENNSFTWKQVVDEDTGIKVRLGSIPVEPCQLIPSVWNMVNVSLKLNKSLKDQVTDLTERGKKDEAKLNNALEQLQECQLVNGKMENELFGRFLAVLNAKKAKISRLDEELSRIKSDTVQPPRRKPIAKRANKSKKVIEKDSYDEDTEEDVPQEQSTVQSPRSVAGTSLPVTDPPLTVRSTRSKTAAAIAVIEPTSSGSSLRSVTRNTSTVTDPSSSVPSTRSVTGTELTVTDPPSTVPITKSGTGTVAGPPSAVQSTALAATDPQPMDQAEDSDTTVSDEELANTASNMNTRLIDSDKSDIEMTGSTGESKMASERTNLSTKSLPVKNADLLDFFFGGK